MSRADGSTPRSGGRSHRYRTTSRWPCDAASWMAQLRTAGGFTPRSLGRSHRDRTKSMWPCDAASRMAWLSPTDGSTPRPREYPTKCTNVVGWAVLLPRVESAHVGAKSHVFDRIHMVPALPIVNGSLPQWVSYSDQSSIITSSLHARCHMPGVQLTLFRAP